MRVDLFGTGVKGKAAAITAQSRVNCFVERQIDVDRTKMALIGSPGKSLFAALGAQPSRGMWAVNTIPTPLLFTVNSGTLRSINSAGTVASIGMIGTTSGNVSMVDDGTHLLLVDGVKGYYYNMLSPGALTEISDGNFTTSPQFCTWLNTYFIVNAGADNQFQLSDGNAVQTWPAVNINFSGAAPGALQACMASHSVVSLFGDRYSEYWQNTNAPDFPLSRISGSSDEYGLASPWSLIKYDNSLAGLFRNSMGQVNISRLSGFRLQRLSNFELESIINDYDTVDDCEAFAYMSDGHPFAQFNFPTAGKSWVYDGSQNDWSELKDAANGRDWGCKFAVFGGRRLVSDYRNGNIYEIDNSLYTNNGELLPFEVTSKHIYQDDKYVGIQQIQIDVQPGVGLATGQGDNPQMMLFVSRDGGNSFTETAWTSIGKVGAYTTRAVWRSLGAARDWVLRLRITDPVYRVITGASAEIQVAGF